jgi:hypothetical protein
MKCKYVDIMYKEYKEEKRSGPLYCREMWGSVWRGLKDEEERANPKAKQRYWHSRNTQHK